MRFQGISVVGRIAIFYCFALAFSSHVFGQTSTGIIRGSVTDPSGAAVADTSIIVTSASGQTLGATTGHLGAYEVQALAPGTYKVEAVAKGFALYEKDGVAVQAGQTLTIDIRLALEVEKEKVTVSAEAPTVNVNPENNAGAIVISGKALDALSDDPDELQSDLQALAGPSAGPNGGQMYIDGFTAGQLPPKSSIREIRINQNPFSSEYDKLGYGRIEIFTKPGTDKFHGQFEVMGNDSAFNSKNPFLGTTTEPGYDSTMFNGNFGGPLSKHASFFIDAQRRDTNDIGAVDATILDANFNPEQYTTAVPNNRTRTNISPRLDYQLTKNNTLTVRYQYWRNNNMNTGIGQFSLPSEGYNDLDEEHTLQASDTQVIGSNIVNETRFQYLRERETENALNAGYTISVPGAFTSGGNSIGNYLDTQNHYELQNYTSWVHGKHFFKFGGRIRQTNDSNTSTSGYNGTFNFPSLAAYTIEEQGLQNLETPAEIVAAGGGPSQFSITQGIPQASVGLFDAGLYFQDDYRIRPNITLSAGLRFEAQTHISDHDDWAPRIAVAWGIGHANGPAPKTVLRVGWGIFYDRFGEDQVLEAERLNGITQQSYKLYDLAAANCFPVADPTTNPACSFTQSSSIPTIYQIAPNLHAPYTMQTAVSLERQVTKTVTLSVSYLNARGEHELFTNNMNAPEPGTFAAGAPVYPNGIAENIFQYESEGIFRQNQLIINPTVRAFKGNLLLFGYYTLNFANSDASGVGSFPSNPYDVLQDYGRASFDVRNRGFFGGSIGLPYGFRISPFMIANSGTPYSVTLSQDLIGSGVINQRPSFATSSAQPGYIVTSLGTFNANPGLDDVPIPINSLTGPSNVSLNLRLSKTFGFGPATDSSAGGGGGGHGPGGGGGGRGPGGPWGGGGGMGMGGGGTNHRYNLTLSVSGRNIFNHENLGLPSAVLNPATTITSSSVTTPEPATISPFFGHSTSLAGGPFSSNAASRLIYLQASFNF
jgi:Carboxypeptidase regulatory-like domain